MMGAPESLCLLRPTSDETDLLRAFLRSGDAGRQAWARWQQAVGEPTEAFKRDVAGVKALLPSLHAGLRDNDTPMPPHLFAALGAADLAETARYRSYARIGARACAALAAAEVAFLLVGGAAYGVTAYPATALRHSHDIDLLIHSEDRVRAVATLERAGFASAAGTQTRAGEGALLLDPSGLPLVLHKRLYRLPYYTPPLAQIWARSQPCDFGGAPMRTMSPADHLLHVCGTASCSSGQHRLKWAADAWHLLARHADLDWDVLLATAAASRLDLPVATLLDYLAGELEAPVPAAALARLRQRAAVADRGAREVAFVGLRGGARSYRQLMAATPSARGRAELLRWILLPSPTSLRLGEPLRWPWAWPAYYLARPIAYLARRVLRRPATAS